MYQLMRIGLCCVGGALLALRAYADDADRPRSPSFNPFSRAITDDENGSSATITRSNDSDASSGFKWPSLPKPTLPTLPALPSLPKPSLPKLPIWKSATSTSKARSRANDEPSIWTKMNNNTKNLYTKTKQTLMPWADDDEDVKTAGGVRRPARTATRAKTKTAKKSFLPSWLGGGEEEKPIRTVNDFLDQPRVGFD